MSDPDDPASWVAKAEADMLCIRNNMAAQQVPWDTVAFHAQQAAEKMLKALLVKHLRPIPRTHDLPRLLSDAVDVEPDLATLAEDASLLTPYAVVLRYPGEPVEPDESEARAAVAAAQRISDAVRAKL